MHCYFNRTIERDQKNQKLTSHFEDYIAAIQEQEIPTK